jgi:hypothetical protein
LLKQDIAYECKEKEERYRDHPSLKRRERDPDRRNQDNEENNKADLKRI